MGLRQTVQGGIFLYYYFAEKNLWQQLQNLFQILQLSEPKIRGGAFASCD